jgi:FkbM family methyltransferase
MKISKKTIEKWVPYSEYNVKNLVLYTLQILPQTQVTIMDIGSNIGSFVKCINDKITVRDAVLIEPIRELLHFSKTYTNPNFKFEQVALSNYNKTVDFYISNTWNLGVNKILDNTNVSTRKIKVEKFNDNLAIKYKDFHPTIIKIDVEGEEFKVLEHTLEYIKTRNLRPLIIIEVIKSQCQDDIKNFYASLGDGYKIVDKYASDSCDLFFVPKEYNV